MQSLRARLSVSLIVSLIVLFTAQWFVVTRAIRSLTDDYVASRLTRDITSLLAMVTFTDDGKPEVDMSRLESSYTRPLSGHYFQIRTAQGQVIRSRSLWDETLAIPAVAVGDTTRVHLQGPKNQRMLILLKGIQKQGHDLSVAVGEDLAPLEQELWQFEQRYVLVSLIILVLLIAVQALIVRLGFLPLQRVRRDIARLVHGEITQLSETVPTEVRPLVQEMNWLLHVMEQRLQRSRHALGNLAHALKTPLTLVMQVAERDDIRTLPEARAQLMEHTAVLRQRLDRELRRARLAGAALGSQRLLLDEAMPPLVRVLQSVYHDKGLDIQCCIGPHVAFTGDREDCMELLGNLLDNACQWAHHKIIVSASVQEDAALVVTVADDGPGCAPEVLSQITQRGVCLDESSSGHGLGLAIVKEIVEQYGGTISFGPSNQLGGLQVQVTLPSARTHPVG